MRGLMNRPLPTKLRCLFAAAKKGMTGCFEPVRTSFFSAQPKGRQRGRVLIAHLVQGVLRPPNDPLIQTHNHFLEARLMTEVFLELGYAVDFIDYRNGEFVPRHRYDVFICPRIGFEQIANRLPAECIKIVHLDTAHWLYNNTAALRRLQEVQQRRGVALSSYTEVQVNRAIETADYATLLGNDFDYETYRFAGKRVFQLPNPGTRLYPWMNAKDFSASRTRFLWLGSRGLVHKGLDLTLEAFVRMPDLHLTVCGPIESDRQFVEAFRTELYETPNIHTYGWIDITGKEFLELARHTIAHVYPTSADACCGSVVNCMHAGLIPIATREAGVDIATAFGITISSRNVAAVEAAVRKLASLPATRLAEMARASWDEAQRVYSPETYKRVLSSVIQLIVSGHLDGIAAGFVPMDTALALTKSTATEP